MKPGDQHLAVAVGDGRKISRAEFLSLLDTYNCFLKDKTQLHLHYHLVRREEGATNGRAGQERSREEEVVMEGILPISWGVRSPIRLKMQDEKQTFPLTSPATPGPVSPISPLEAKRGMTRWGEFDNLHHIDEIEETNQEADVESKTHCTGPRLYESTTLMSPSRLRAAALEEEQTNLIRCMSDASLVKRRRGRSRTSEEKERNRQHRFSINGHFYNYKTSIFTPSYGTSTNVQINSTMTTQQVIGQLLHKFKIENDPQEFALYCVHQSGEKRRLGEGERPLWERVLQGPSDDFMRMFLMDRDEEEVSNDVAQYLNLELPLLEGVLQKLEEEENREVQRVINKYHQQQRLLSQCLNTKIPPNIETSV
ncbi:ras association domain-containing protein 6 [Osmerus mordax]|uniref:ras association domain-containing protein 6 n=1 Tax=Osmerus mordax TaxID=8014 RepID=UPI00350F36DB